MVRQRVRLYEALGLRDPLPRLREALIAFTGAADVPPSRFGRTSLRQIRPLMGMKLWLGKEPVPRRAIITNLFNHTQTPIERGWSVRVTQVEDFRGKSLTYDSHNGTDFSIPLGSTVSSPAPGEVVRVYSEYNRGGNKLVLDHGGGLFTSFAHLTEAKVRVGDRVRRGQAIAVSGYSGLDGMATFPFGTPHIHFNVWLDGAPVDPFPHRDEASLWMGGSVPEPAANPGESAEAEPVRTRFDDDAVSAAVNACVTTEVRERLEAIEDSYLRATTLVAEWNYYPTRFPLRPEVIVGGRQRGGILSLPLSADEVDGVVFADEL